METTPAFEPLLIEFAETLDTPRLRLAVPRPADGVRIYPSVRASIEQLNAWMPWAKPDYSEADAETWCRRARGEFHLRRQLQFLMTDRETGEHLGNVGAFKFNWEPRCCEIGYWLRTDRTGRGLMTEAVAALGDYLIRELAFVRIEIRCDDRNRRSWRVAERAGYRLDGVLPNHGLAPDGSLRATRIYSRIAG